MAVVSSVSEHLHAWIGMALLVMAASCGSGATDPTRPSETRRSAGSPREGSSAPKTEARPGRPSTREGLGFSTTTVLGEADVLSTSINAVSVSHDAGFTWEVGMVIPFDGRLFSLPHVVVAE